MYSPEREALKRFVTLFIILNTLFLLIISSMYYYYQKTIFTELRYDSMIHYAKSRINHVYGSQTVEELKSNLLHSPHDPRFEIGFLDTGHNLIYSSDPNLTFPFKMGIHEYKGHYIYIDTIKLEHLTSIRYIVIQAQTVEPQLKKTRQSIYLILIFSILFLSLAMYTLSKLFLLPVRETISKLDRFIRDTTHELNTPLTVITMSLEQLRKSPLAADQSRPIERIDVASRTISNLYNDLTFFLMYGQNKNLIVPIDLAILFTERIDYFRPIAASKKITLDFELQTSTLSIDREKMVRLIDNLLSNAIKYNKPAGKITITLAENTFSIEDTGIGIPQEKIDLIFNRYTRFDEANGGFGIGLNLVKMICREFDLRIQVHSKVGFGTTFTLSWGGASH